MKETGVLWYGGDSRAACSGTLTMVLLSFKTRAALRQSETAVTQSVGNNSSISHLNESVHNGLRARMCTHKKKDVASYKYYGRKESEGKDGHQGTAAGKGWQTGISVSRYL